MFNVISSLLFFCQILQNEFSPPNVLRLKRYNLLSFKSTNQISASMLSFKSTNQISASISRTFNNQSNIFSILFAISLKI